MIIAFSFLSLLNEDYKKSIVKFNDLDKTGWLHFDVMDGNFVTNKTFDFNLVKEINNYNKLFSDVHLMITNPEDVIENYSDVGVDQLTFHFEAVEKEDVLRVIEGIKKCGIKVGISIKPATDVEVLDEYLPLLDYILIMSVEPGKGGQQFIDSSLEKIKYLKDRQSNNNYLIGVDGGINDHTSLLVKAAGADVIIVGSYLSKNLSIETINKIK